MILLMIYISNWLIVKKSILSITPIYKPILNYAEFFSLKSSFDKISFDKAFIYPRSLDLEYYFNNFSGVSYFSIDDYFFLSHSNYNKLMYEIDFYRLFSDKYDYTLILQTDAIVINEESYLNEFFRYDYVGSPEFNEYSYDISFFANFSFLKQFQPIKLHGCNGGLSLRKLNSFISVLDMYRELANFFKNYGVGIGEDIFFSLISKIDDSFYVPNEFRCSKFGFTNCFMQWHKFNNFNLPFGLHSWYNNIDDFNYIADNILFLNKDEKVKILSSITI